MPDWQYPRGRAWAMRRWGSPAACWRCADSEFRHELEADIEPFKGLLMGLFFIAVGMAANLGLIREGPFQIFGLALALIAVKFALMYAIARVSGTANDTAQRRAVALFKDHDEAQLEAQYAVHDDQEQLIQTTRQAADQLQALFEADISRRGVARTRKRRQAAVRLM